MNGWTLLAMIDNFEWAGWAAKYDGLYSGTEAFVVTGLLNAWDLTVLIPLCVYCVQGVAAKIKANKAVAPSPV